MFTITACPGREHCFVSIGRQEPFVLRLSRAGSRVSGVLQVNGVAVPVEGEVSATGSLSARGLRPAPTPDLPTVELTSFTSATDDFTHAELAYEFRYLPGAYYHDPNTSLTQSTAGFVSRVVRGAVTPETSFEGMWDGDALISDCSAVSASDCWPDEKGLWFPLTLLLTQNGDRVSGTLSYRRTMNVTGSVSGNSVTFDETTVNEGSGSVFRLKRSTLTRDAAGHLTGTIQYARENGTRVLQMKSDVTAVLIP